MSAENGINPNLIAEALTPLVAAQDQLRAELTALEDQVSDKKGELKRIEKHLLLEGMIEPPQSQKKAKQKRYKWAISDVTLDAARETLSDMGSEDFTLNEFRDNMPIQVADATVRKAIDTLRESNEVRLKGKRGMAHVYCAVE